MRPLNGKGPAAISPPLLHAIRYLAEKEGVSSDRVTQAVADLSRLFTKERTDLSRPYLDDPAFAAAYLQYFLPVNLSKIQVLLDELPDESCSQTDDRFTVLDIGSGPGTGALAVLDWWCSRQPVMTGALSVVAVDNQHATLRQAEQLWKHYCRQGHVANADLKTCQGDVQQRAWLGRMRRGASFDLVILANCLNEMYAEAKDPIAARSDLVTELLALLAPHGTVMLVEPALRETARALHQVRDQLLQKGSCSIYSPCLHHRNCPALVNPDDWCHEERAWQAPAGIREIDEAVGFIKDALKFSYLLLRTDGRTIAPRSPNTFRIVSELRRLKGDTRAWLCNELGRFEVGKLDRAKSASNSVWEECERGTIVRIESITRKEGASLGRIPEKAIVEIVRSV
ncbi:MAG TPA: small ribosomal subunit Rsm22 family protein [Nitrospira sp.]|nr:small ribosomal subunit Rsm22 family protein [Nitrospira sp.]